MSEEDDGSAKKWPSPRDAFYITADINAHNAIDVSLEGKDAMTLDAAIEYAVQDVRDNGGVRFVVECRAVRRVADRNPCVQKFKTR